MTERFDPARFSSKLSPRGHTAFVGIRYVGHGEDWVDLSFDPREELMADPGRGVLASGPLITLMDVATSVAIWIRRGEFAAQVTLDLRVDYLRPAREAMTIIGHAECYRITRRIAFVRGYAHEGEPDDPIAHATGTFMMLEGPR